MTIEELKQLKGEALIKKLKSTPAKRPETEELLKDWDYEHHDVFNQSIRKNRKVLVEEETLNPDGTIDKPARFKEENVNRIALPLEQDIVNIHTAFTVGEEPTLTCNSEDESEKELFTIVQKIYSQNKIKYENKRLVRSWLSECEVAEYWFTTGSDNWWSKILNKLNYNSTPKRKLKSVIWSPFRGDKLYPFYDEYGDMIAFSREYKTKDESGKEITKLMVIDAKEVIVFSDGKEIDRFPHGFKKIPVIYMNREKPLCHKIRTMRDRLETLLSNFADCLDYNFYPKLVATGDLEGIQNRGTTSEIINLKDGGNVAYLTWRQSPDMARMEFENLTNRCYSLTNTPQITFENLQNIGNIPSGRAFKFMFMGTHMAVSNHAEVVEEFLQRRVNFIISAIGSIYTKMSSISDRIIVETEIVPYMINNRTEDINDAVTAVSGGVSSIKQGIILAGISDRVDEELEAIKEDKQVNLFEPTE